MTMGRMVKLATIRSFPRIIFLPNRNSDQAPVIPSSAELILNGLKCLLSEPGRTGIR